MYNINMVPAGARQLGCINKKRETINTTNLFRSYASNSYHFDHVTVNIHLSNKGIYERKFKGDEVHYISDRLERSVLNIIQAIANHKILHVHDNTRYTKLNIKQSNLLA